MNAIQLEICIDSVASAQAAATGGADRIELCGHLPAGGLTPSLGLIEKVRESCPLPAMLMIRPRAGDFVYSEAELRIMEHDIALAQALGLQGVVFGILQPDRSINRDETLRLVEAARPLEVTFHRAFDLVPDPLAALDTLMELGVDRLLSSGQAVTAYQGRSLIRQLVQRAGGQLQVMPGTGVRPENVKQLLLETGAREVHASASQSIPGPWSPFAGEVFFGDPATGTYQRKETASAIVADLKAALK